MKRSYCLSVLLALTASGVVWAQGGATSCLELSADASVQGPAEADSVKIADLDGRTLGNLEFAVDEGRWTPDELTIAKIQGAVAAAGELRSQLRLLWFAGSERIQTDPFVLPDEDRQAVCPAPDQPPPPPPDDAGEVAKEAAEPASDGEIRNRCHNDFLHWNAAIESRLGHERYLAILFGPDGQIIEENKDYGVAGDLIYTAACKLRGSQTPIVKFTKCDLQSAIPKSPEGAEVVVPQADEIRTELIEYPVRQCFGNSAEVSFKLGSIDETHTIGLYERYRYTLQVGALSTDQHPHSFGLRPDGDESRIFDKGPIDEGPEYVATVVLYALPRYLGSLVRGTQRGELEGLEALAARTYHGRDVVNDHAFGDRLGLVVGVGLDHPRDRFVVGLSFELIPGVNVVGVYEWAKLKELAGVADDDVFAGDAEDIPTRDDWEEKTVFGLSLDLRYVAGLFKRGT